ncbi:MAG: histidine kinase [Microcystis aeruginosa Ma_AC_P_19900807_S299]|jgi:two-component system clock-associated histidine kinase SasA|nr:MAG: histidine kinase [Microcystis aeruginosa Ma_AC_P_19900807_S299]
MLPSNEPLTALGRETTTPLSIQLLLFVDDRPSSQEIIRQIQSYLQSLKSDYPIDLQIIEIRQQPHLVEHFRLVATPALVKIAPVPRHTLAGSNLVEQFKQWLVRWQKAIKEEVKNHHADDAQLQEVEHSGELIRIADEVFRLKQEKEELLEQLKFKDQILAMLAHDLRSPLTAASIAVETLELAYHQPDTERSLQLREQLHQQARKQFRIMNRLITDILQASKSMAAQFTLHQSKFYLQSLCQEILSQFTDTFQEKTLILQSDIPQDLPPVYADEELIRQVIINLLENGIKYTPAGGEITLSVLHRTTQKVQVSISDTGPGIPEEKQEHIFEGHVRLKRDEGKEGYGIGLSVCRKIIRAHYGQIWVDSVPDHGSSFHFTLPVYR